MISDVSSEFASKPPRVVRVRTPKRRWNFLYGVGIGLVASRAYQNMTGFQLNSFLPFGSTSRSITVDFGRSTPPQKETLHVLFGLMGNKIPLFDAWEVALKSVLVNAPLDADLKVHIICNEDAHRIVKEKIDKAELVGSVWRNQITITSYNVEALNDSWLKFLTQKIRQDRIYERVSLGGYYRLLAYKILGPMGVGPTLYMDTDVVILSNLNDLMKSMDDSKVFQGSPGFFCSGFTIVNMRRFHEFWEKVDQIEKDPMPVADQDIMLEVKNHFPDTFGPLPMEWDRNLGNGWRRTPHRLMEKKQAAAGMLHFQGGTGRNPNQNYFTKGFTQYCQRTPKCRDNPARHDMFARSWGLADFYTRLSWKWAKYFGKSMIPSDQRGKELQLHSFTATPPPKQE